MICVFDLYKIGIGPSSSHTVGPMKAARQFALALEAAGLLESLEAVQIELYGSLALTGKGHGTDNAILLGLAGEQPEKIATEQIAPQLAKIHSEKRLRLLGRREIQFDVARDLIFNYQDALPYHINGMRFTAFRADQQLSKIYYSVGGGFVVAEDELADTPQGAQPGSEEDVQFPYSFNTAEGLLSICERQGLAIWQVMLENEKVNRSQQEIREGILGIWEVMQACVQRGYHNHEPLPGGMNIKRRAPDLYAKLTRHPEAALQDPLTTMDWVNLYAIAVNEENAAGGQVVTAPTNGAAGIIPAVLHYYCRFVPNADEDGIVRFFLTSAAIGVLYKENASISGAEVGCQGEVGVACSMAAAGLAEVRGGTIYQVENAAEIGMEHNLGLTCDPVNGLVQIPCIERNAMGAIKAINAARIALRGDGKHNVSLDNVIATMRQTGEDMNNRYKETSLGGLAVNVVEC